MDIKLKKILKKNKYKLATSIDNSNTLIYVDNLEAWKHDTSYGKYTESLNSDYKKIIIMINGSGFKILKKRDFAGRYYGLRPILSDLNKKNNELFPGSSIDDLYRFIKSTTRGTSNIYIPYECIKIRRNLKRKDLRLCFIDEGIAYFTNNNNQQGDNWSDAPYQYNAKEPYIEDKYEILKLGFYTGYQYSEPCDYFHNQYFSVKEINCRFVPWLIPDNTKLRPIFAGETLKEFVYKIEEASGIVLYCIKIEGN